MMGIRTPVKRPTRTGNPPGRSPQGVTEEAGPSKPHSVRRSVGEWEAGMGERQSISPAKIAAKEPQRRANTPPLAPKRAPIVLEIEGSPTTTSGSRNTRVAEARKCLLIVKQQMALSKNIKREIKEDVKSQVERLYALVKEAEADRGRVSSPTPSAMGTENSQSLPPTLTSPVQASVERRIGESEIESLKKAMEEHSRKLAESNAKIDGLKEALQSNQDRIGRSTYATVAASQPVKQQTPRHTALHSIIVTALDEKETGEGVLNTIRKTVDAKEGWITVEKVRKARDRKIIMGCKTAEERAKVKERLKAAPGLKVEDIENKNPLVMLKNVMSYNTNEDIAKALLNQNKNIFSGLEGKQKNMEIMYRRRTRNEYTCHVVLRVATEVWKRMLEAGAVHIDLQRIKVEDQSPLVQCSICLGYGHGRRLCTETIPKCSHCGGPHMRATCAEWLSGAAPTCSNCTRAKAEKTDHNAFSPVCPVRKRWDALARSAVAYC